MANPEHIPIKWTSREKIERACAEIEKQWAHHLLIRAAFPFRISKTRSNQGAGYYLQHGIDIRVQLPNESTPMLKLGLDDVGAWANQNFVIRLFGVLDGAGLIEAGMHADNPFVAIVKHLRNNVGAHSSGVRDSRRSDAAKAVKLIQQHLDSRVLPKNAKTFNLDIKEVLEPLKEGCVAFALSLLSEPDSP